MNPTLYVTLALALTMLFGWLAVRLITRSAASRASGRPSIVVVLLSIGSWVFLSFMALSMALSTTNVVQTYVVMSNMRNTPPFAAIAETDPSEWERLRSAVSRGLERANGADVQVTVIKEIERELAPYMNRRLSTAPDGVYLALAPIVSEAMLKSRALGTCIVPADARSSELRRHFDPKRILLWSNDLVNSAPISPRAGDVGARRAGLIERSTVAGTARADVVSALTPDATTGDRCLVATRMLQAAVANPDRVQGASDIRIILDGFRLPG